MWKTDIIFYPFPSEISYFIVLICPWGTIKVTSIEIWRNLSVMQIVIGHTNFLLVHNAIFDRNVSEIACYILHTLQPLKFGSYFSFSSYVISAFPFFFSRTRFVSQKLQSDLVFMHVPNFVSKSPQASGCVSLHYSHKISDFYFGRLIFGLIFAHFGQISDIDFGHFAKTLLKQI